jgi:hypothetical protein
MITWQQFNEQALNNHMEEVASWVCKNQRGSLARNGTYSN